MKDLPNKLASVAATAGIFALGCVMAALGLSLMVLLAMFGLAVVGLAALASPFVALAKRRETNRAETVAA